MVRSASRSYSDTRATRKARKAQRSAKKNNRKRRRGTSKKPRLRVSSRKQQKNRRQKRSRRHGLIVAVGKWFPSQFFSHWKVTGGSKWSPQRLFWMALLMMWNGEQTLTDRFHETRRTLRALFPKWPLGKTYTGWYEAQLRWIEPLKRAFAKRLQAQMQLSAGRWWRREGWCAFAADGSRVECPRTTINEEVLGCAGRKKTGPQLFVTTLWHMGMGLPWDFRVGPGTASERRHLEEMALNLPLDSLLVADAGFVGYDLCQRILKARHNFLLRVGANVCLLRKLGYARREGRDTVYLWPDRERSHAPLVLRLLKLRRENKTMYLVTNVLDHEALSQESAGVLYELRWGIEVFYRSFKQTMQRRTMLSHTPKAAECELIWTMFGLWLLGLMSVASIMARGAEPLSWSVALARTRVRHSMRAAVIVGFVDRALSKDLGRTVKDDYARQGSKKARDWPHKKKEKPPGAPKLRMATPAQRQAAQKLNASNAAA